MTRHHQLVHVDYRLSVQKISSRSTEARRDSPIEYFAQTSWFQRRRSPLPHHGEACFTRIANSSVRRKLARSRHGANDGTYHLLQNPEMRERLFGELLTVWPDLSQPPRFEALERLPYLVSNLTFE